MLDYHAGRQTASVAAVCFLLIAAIPAWSADRYLIDTVTLESSASIPQNVVNGVNPKGWILYTRTYNVKDTICEIFLAKTVSANTSARQSADMPYSSLKEGTFVGVLHLLPEATEDYSADSHNQTLRPGYYTMRYAVMPAGTYEHGTKPGEFVVLSPVSLDKDPSRTLTLSELTRLGRSASGTEVPASVELVPPDGSVEQSPAVKMDQTYTCIFQVRLPLASRNRRASKEMPIAFALLTPLHGPEGS